VENYGLGFKFAAPLILVRCHYCSTHVHPKEIVNIGESALMCWNCRELHTTQIEAFAPPPDCQGCKRTFEEIAAATEGEQVKMYPVWKDGVYQVLCESCEAEYVQKRKDLYGATRFGWERKLN
jgi:hypothetical protein